MSNFLNLNAQDLLKGLTVAVLWVILTGVYTLYTSWSVISLASLEQIWLAGLMAWVSYLIKNVFTNSQWNLLQAEQTTTPTSYTTSTTPTAQ